MVLSEGIVLRGCEVLSEGIVLRGCEVLSEGLVLPGCDSVLGEAGQRRAGRRGAATVDGDRGGPRAETKWIRPALQPSVRQELLSQCGVRIRHVNASVP
eukprot:1952916-Rhodomonas_salina.1